MSPETTIAGLPWWQLAEVADHDADVFGPTAWSLEYYWAVKAQNGTAMFTARTDRQHRRGQPAGSGAETAGPEAGSGLGPDAGPDACPEADSDLAGWIVMSAAGSAGLAVWPVVVSATTTSVLVVLRLGLATGSRSGSAGNGDRGGGGDVEGVLEELHELGQLEEGHLLEGFKQFIVGELRHGGSPFCSSGPNPGCGHVRPGLFS